MHLADSEPRLLRAGDLVLFPRDVPHAVSNDSTPPPRELVKVPARVHYDMEETFNSILCGYYVFESEVVQALLNDLPDVVLLQDARANPATVGVGHIIDAALVEMENDYPGRITALSGLARLMLLHLLRGRYADGSSTGYLTALVDPQIGKALLQVHSRYGEDWTLDRLAREVGMSRTSFANRFNTYVGMPAAKQT